VAAPIEPVIVAPQQSPTLVPTVSPEILEARIEAAHPEHEVSGPAEPPEAVPALGEMPVEEPPETPAPEAFAAAAETVGEEVTPSGPAVEPEAPEVVADEAETIAEQVAPPPAPSVPSQPDIPEDMHDLPPPRPRPSAPAGSPAAPFNPEVLPVED